MNNQILSRLLNGQSKSVTSAAVILAIAGLASRFLGMIRQRMMVGAFGAGNTLDSYFAAFQIPDFAFNLLIAATLSAAFIPVFCEYLEKDRQEAWKIASSVLNLIIIFMGLLCLLFFICSKDLVFLISPGFTGDKYLLTVKLTRILLLSPWLFAISAVFSGILNSFKNFTLIAIAPILYNLGIIFGIIFLAPSFGIYGVAYGVILGAFLHILIQIPGARKFGFRWQIVADIKNKGVREIMKLIAPRILSVDISQISQLIGTIFGSTLVVGSVAIFNLVYNIEAVPIAVFAISFIVSVFPVLSTAAAQKDSISFRNNFSYVARQILFFLVPLTILTFIFRAQVVRLIIGAQKLSWDETRVAAAALAIFGFSFIFQGISLLLSRAFYAIKNTVIPLIVSLASIAVNVLATYIFLRLLSSNGIFKQLTISYLRLDGIVDLRILALPFGFSIAALFSTFVLFLILRKKFGRLDGKKIFSAFLKYLLAGAASGIFGYFGLYLIEPILGTKTFLGVLGQLVFSMILAGTAFILVALALKSEEMQNLVRSARLKMFKSVERLSIEETKEM